MRYRSISQEPELHNTKRVDSHCIRRRHSDIADRSIFR